MENWIKQISSWIEQFDGFWYVVGGSLVFTVLFTAGIILFFLRTSHEYFYATCIKQAKPKKNFWGWVRCFAKNGLGYLLILFGLATFMLPSQSFIAIFLGFLLVEFKAKNRIIHFILDKTHVLKKINQRRAVAGRKPLRLRA